MTKDPVDIALRGAKLRVLCTQCFAILAVCQLLLSCAEAKVTYSRVAVTGDAVLGSRMSESFGGGGNPVINDSGDVAFFGGLSDTSLEENRRRGLFTTVGGELRLVVGNGDAAPGSGANADSFNIMPFVPPVLNDSGKIAFTTEVLDQTPDAARRQALFSDEAGSLKRIGSMGNTFPTTSGSVAFRFLSRDTFRLNDKGDVAFGAFGNLVNQDDRSAGGIWFQRGDELTLDLQSGTPAPDAGPRVEFGDVANFALNDQGDFAVFARVFRPSPGIIRNNAVYFSPVDGPLQLLAQEDNSVVIGDETFTVEDLIDRPPALNADGTAVFSARLSGPGFSFPRQDAILSNSSDGLRLLARDGQPLPSIGEGVSLNVSRLSLPIINSSGDTAFSAFVSGPNIDTTNSQVIVVEREGELEVIAQRGEPAPGAGAGVVFGNPFIEIALNGLGQVAFRNELAGPGIEDNQEYGLFATDANGVVQMVARTGTLFDVDPDPTVTDNRLIDFVWMVAGADGSDGTSSSFNNAGQFAFQLGFADGTSGVFVATIGTIPEPSAGVLLAFALASISLHRYRTAQ